MTTLHFYPPEPHQVSSNPTSIPRNNIAKSTRQQDNSVILKQENPVREALFSTAGRRYGRGRFSRRPGNKNPIGRDGKRMRCRGCNSDEHFIADCNERDKPKLITFANDLIVADALNYSGNQILEMIQELPDDIWDLFLSSQVDMQHEADQPANKMEPKEAMFASLANMAAMHEFIGPKALNDIQDRLHIGDASPRTLSLSKLCVSPRTAVSVMTTSKVPGIRSVSQFLWSDNTFEGIMLDRGASGTLSGLPAYLR